MSDASCVSVSQYCLTVDADDTVRAVLDSAGTVKGQLLKEALCLPNVGLRHRAIYPVAPGAQLDDADLDPRRTDLVDVDPVSSCTDAMLRKLEEAGYLTIHDVWHDTSGQTYASEGRTLTAVCVQRAFSLVAVAYSWSSPAAMGYADQWIIAACTPVVDMGWYVIGETGDYRSSLVGVAYIGPSDDRHRGDVVESLFFWVSETPGFCASHCYAECDTCGSRWETEEGSWHFTPEYGTDATEWDFDDAEGFGDDDTVTCPACQKGRVGFLIT